MVHFKLGTNEFCNQLNYTHLNLNRCNELHEEPQILEEPFYASSESEVCSDVSSGGSSSEDEVEIIDYLYPESKITVKELLITVNLMKLKHSLSSNATNHIMELLKTILPQPNKCPRSLRKCQKYFLPCDSGSFSKNFTICSICNNLLEEKRSKDFRCAKCLTDQSLIPFLTFDVKKQLEIILSNPVYVNQIRNTVTVAKSLASGLNSSSIGGIYYQNCVKKIASDLIVSLNINSDGAPLTKYKSFSIWPVIGTIVELNHSSREKFENIIVFGMWISRRKPLYNEFFKTVFKELSFLVNKTVKMNGKPILKIIFQLTEI